MVVMSAPEGGQRQSPPSSSAATTPGRARTRASPAQRAVTPSSPPTAHAVTHRGDSLQRLLAAGVGDGSPASQLRVLRNLHPGVGSHGLQRLLQRALTVSAPADLHEREAERAADHVMRMPAVAPLAASRPSLQRKPALQASLGDPAQAPLDVAARIAALRGAGEPLPDAARDFFEPRFGTDLGQVRVHTGREAAEIADSLHARAFATGQDVVFGAGEYAPDTGAGKRLLAHELAHTIQQRGGDGATTAGPELSLTSSPATTVMRKGFESTFEVCHRVLETRRFKVENGGVRVLMVLDGVDKSIVNCEDFTFGVTLTKEVDWWADNEFGTCEATTGGARSFSFANVPAGTYYLTIWRSFDHPYCCLSGDIAVFDEKISADSGSCTRDKDPSVMDIVHGALGLAGFIPVLGAVPDGIDAVIYVAEGDWTSAGISAAAMVPLFGDGAKLVAIGGKQVIKASGKSVVKMGEKELAAGLKKAVAEKASREAAVKAAQKLATKGAKRGEELLKTFDSLNDARTAARSAAGLGDEAVDFVQELGPFTGRVTGRMSPDGLKGWRIDFDQAKGFHVNWWDRTAGAKRADWLYGANTIRGGTYDDFLDLLSHFP